MSGNSRLPETDPALASVPFAALLARHRRVRPGKLALVDGATGESATYAQLHDRVARLAAGLAAQGIGPGDRVACLALNGKAYTEMFLAIAWRGAVIVPLNIRLSAAELRFIIADAGASAIFSCPNLVVLADAALEGTAFAGPRILAGGTRPAWIEFDSLMIAAASEGIPEGVSGDSLYMLLYTSGTTGKPKGCMIAQRTWLAYAAHMVACFQLGDGDTYLAFLPYFHVAGFGTAASHLLLGGTVVTAARADPAHFHRLVAQHRISILFLVPGISAAFVHDPTGTPTSTASLRLFISGAGVEKLELVDAVEARLGARYVGIYGQTEAGSKVTWADGTAIRRNPSTYGQVVPFYDYRIVDDDDRDVPPGGVGELCVRGAGVMVGYWQQPQATRETLRNGWLHTGDLFEQLGDGELRMVDRKKYLIKTGGENVYPQEVEAVLMRHDGIADAAVFGMPDAHWGEQVVACIVPKPGCALDAATVIDWVGAHIAGYKKPRRVEFVAALPRNVSGKVLKDEVAALIGRNAAST